MRVYQADYVKSFPLLPQVLAALRERGVQDHEIAALARLGYDADQAFRTGIQFYSPAGFVKELQNRLGWTNPRAITVVTAVQQALSATPRRAECSTLRRFVMVILLIAKAPLVMAAGAAEPQQQYAELVELFGRLPALQLKRIRDLYDPDREKQLLGKFYKKGSPKIPFFLDGECGDFRFADMFPEEMRRRSAPFKTPEAKALSSRKEALLFRAASGSGKTSTILDVGCVEPMIYVACNTQLQPSETELEEATTRDEVFPLLVNALSELWKKQYTPVTLPEAQAEADRLIMADICARLTFFLWLHQTYEGITAEQALLAQLNDGRFHMRTAFQELLDAHKDTVQKLAQYCVRELTMLKGNPQPVRVAIDEAQAAAAYLNDPRPGGFHFSHTGYTNSPRDLLYEYTRLWMTLVNQVVVAGTGLASDAADQLSSDVAKNTLPGVQLPFLTVEDVKARLRELLNLQGLHWDKISNLHWLTGRCRLVASVVRELLITVHKHPEKTKVQLLQSCIDEARTRTVKKLARDVEAAITQGTRFAQRVERLVRQLHAMVWLFNNQAQGMRLLFSADDTSDLLGLGLVLRVEGRNDNVVTVAMDKVGQAAVEELAKKREWDAADDIASSIASRVPGSNDGVELGYKFETLVAAALVRYRGTVAELIDAADIDFERTEAHPKRKLPDWTATARFDCKYHVCTDAQEVVDLLESCLQSGERILLHPDDAVRPDFVLVVVGAFLLLGSANCWTGKLSGTARDDDRASTVLEVAYTQKDSEASSANLDVLQASFQSTKEKLAAAMGGRTLRLHVVLPGVAGNRETGDFPHVQVEADGSVRVLIDTQNYEALFTDQLRDVVSGILERKRNNKEARKEKQRKRKHQIVEAVESK